jgi:hypothetical protein
VSGSEARRALPRTSDGFELLSELGSGGMGVVYRARELSTGRVVALKVLRHSSDEEDTTFDRFHREAMLAASLSDSRCVFVYGAHSVEGAPAIAMELVEGETLEQVVARKEPIPVRKAVQWGIELLEALEVAHRAGILHRDVKPSNCFIDRHGHVKLGDFGLSRTVETNVHLTDKGSFLGSPLYAAPEQIRGREVDERSDLYSAAATIYTLLAGRPGWTGNNIQEVFARILSEPPDRLEQLRPDVPAELADIVARAMDKEPARRFESVRALRAALHPFAVEAPPADMWRRAAAYSIDSLLVVLLGWLVLLPWMFLGDTPRDADVWTQRQQGLEGWLALAYFSLTEGRFGRGVGKWVLGLRVESARARSVGVLRATARAALFLVPSFAMSLAILGGATPTADGSLELPLWWGTLGTVWPLLLLVTVRRGNGKRTVHEFFSGTRTTQATMPLQRVSHELVAVETRAPVAEVEGDGILDRYRLRGRVTLTDRGALYLGEDALLERDVWILPAGEEESAVELGLAQRERATRLRWLASFDAQGRRWTVVEAPGGESLANWRAAQDELTWEVILRLLVELAGELASGAEPISIDQLWIDRSHHLRILDFRVGPSGAEPLERHALLAQVARMLLSEEFDLPRDMPGHAEVAMEKVLSGAARDLAHLHGELVSLSERMSHVTVQQRLLQVGSSAVFMALPFLFAFGLAFNLLSSESGSSGESLSGSLAGVVILAVCGFWLLYAALTRGGLMLRLTGLQLRGARGRRAGALVWSARMLVTLSPVLALAVALLMLENTSAQLACAAVAVLLLLAGAVYTIVHPKLGLVDRLLGTRIVPR